MIPDCRSLVTSFLTTSKMTRLSRLCGCLTSFASSSNNILCMYVDGLIPRMSANVHPIAFLCFFRTCNNLCSCSAVREVEMMTGSLPGRGFNSGVLDALVQNGVFNSPYRPRLQRDRSL